jgi:hypothetical protein
LRATSYFTDVYRPFLSQIALDPFEVDGMAHAPVEPDWDMRLVGVWGGDGVSDSLVLLETPSAERGDVFGRLRLMPGSAVRAPKPENRAWSFAATPIDACVVPGYGAVVLCRANSGTGALLFGVPFALGEAAPEELARLAGDLVSVEGQLTLSQDGGHFYVVLSGYPFGAPTAGAALLLQRFDASARAPIGAPLALTGALPRDGRALHTGSSGDAWVAAMQPGGASTQAVRVAPDAEGSLTIRAQYALPIVEPGAQPLLALHGGDVAVALGRRLEIWPGGERRGAGTNYDDAIHALAWSAEGLFVGEAGRVHLVDAVDGAPLESAQLQSGRVVRLITPPPAGPRNDAAEVESAPEAIAGARLELPFELVFRGQAAGKQVRALAIHDSLLEGAAWRVEFDATAMPWLAAAPLSGTGPGESYLTVNPIFYDPETTVTGSLMVRVTMADGTPASGSPARVQVRVDAARAGSRTVLWLLDQESKPPAAYPSLVRMLSGPPLYLSHIGGATPYQGRLEDHAIIVLTTAAAARGAITRQGLLDYVARGGAFLLLATPEEGGSRPMGQWLHALGIHVAPGAVLPPEAQVAANGPASEAIRVLGRHWPPGIPPVASVVTAPPENVAVGTSEGHALLVAREFAYGRIAVLASAAPLAGGGDLLFARTLFQWLQRAGIDSADMDGDGLLDSVEDANDNGVHDPGETDYLLADTDGDGVPDGMEDINLNGRVDDGETDPRNPDSDGDGILDGADPNPVPVEGTPLVARVDGVGGTGEGPAQGPAEGGAAVAITGRNFTQDCTVWFGDVPADEWRVLSSETAYAIAPAVRDESVGLVPVRMVMGATPGPGVLEGRLPGAFLYMARSVVRIDLDAVLEDQDEAQFYRGTLRIHLALPPGVAAGKLILVISTGTEDGIGWGDPEMIEGARRSPSPLLELLGPGQYLLHTPEGSGTMYYGGVTFAIPWELETETVAGRAFRVALSGAFVLTRQGQAINVELGPPVMLVDEAEARTAP